MGPAAPDDDDGGGGGCGGGAEPGEEDEAPDDDDDVLEGGVVAEATQPPASSRSWSNSNEVLWRVRTSSISFIHIYREGHLVVYLSWVDIELDCSTNLICQAAQPLLPNSHQTKQNWAGGGTTKIKVNPTRVLEQMTHPVHTCSDFRERERHFIFFQFSRE